MVEVNSLKQAVLETIAGLLSPAQGQRQLAEEQIKALEVTEEYGVYLCEITLDPEGVLTMRQLAAVLLKQYIDWHWCIANDKFRAPEATPAAKDAIKRMLPSGLSESISKVRNTVAYSISTIAHSDWPDEWPELFDILMQALKSENEFAVQGTVRVLKEFSRDLTDSQIPTVAPVIIPDIYRIFCEPERYTVRTRARAVDIFTTLTSMICTIGEVNKGLQKTLLNPVLTTFSEALVSALSVPDSHSSDAGLKTEVLKALTVLVRHVPKQMVAWMPQILPPVWSTLTTSADKYVQEVVNRSEEDADDEGNGGDAADSDGEVIGFENLVFSIFEFVHALVESKRFKGAVKAGLSDLMYYIVLYMQITEDQCEKWTDNPDSFVEDEDEDSNAYSVRISAQDLLMALCEEFEEESCLSLAQTIEKHLSDLNARCPGGLETVDHAWKIHEAAMLALGWTSEVIEKQIVAQKVQFDISNFLTGVVLADLNRPVHPFLLGRCLWVASKFPTHLPQDAISAFLEATVRGLAADQPHPVRISAVRAIWGFCSHLKAAALGKSRKPSLPTANNGESDAAAASFAESRRQLLVPLLPALVDGLVAMAANFSGSAEILGLIVENLYMVLDCDPGFTATQEAKVTPLAIAIFLKYSSDPVITSLSQDIFMVLSRIPECARPLQNRLVPTLVSILNARSNEANNGVTPQSPGASPMAGVGGEVSGLKSIALDVLGSLVRSTPLPLSDELMCVAFPAIVDLTLSTAMMQEEADNSILQSGGEALRAFMSVAPEQVANWVDTRGHHQPNTTGLQHVVNVAGQLLNPTSSEFSATFVGRLVTTLVQKAGVERLGENLDLLLKAVLSKLQRSETLSVIQSLIMVYAHLIHTQMDSVLVFLSGVPGPTGDSALSFVMTEWVSRQHMFYGAYESKVSIMALAKLLQYGVNNNDDRLNQIMVKGDEIVDPNSKGPRTRSQREQKWTSIPLLAKLLKVLLVEIYQQMEEEEADVDDGDDESDDDEWIEGDGEDGGDARREGVDLSTLLGAPHEYIEEDDDLEDPDAKNDPMYAIDLKQYLVGFLREFSRQPCFQHFNPHLNHIEIATLEKINQIPA